MAVLHPERTWHLFVQYSGRTGVRALVADACIAPMTGGSITPGATLEPRAPSAVGTTVAQGAYLNAAAANEPVVVLGAAAAQRRSSAQSPASASSQGGLAPPRAP